MGLLEHLRPASDEPWIAPEPGSCGCEKHAHALAELMIDQVKVTELLEGEKILAELSEEFFIEGRYGERRGPYEWRLTLSSEVEALFDDDAPAHLDDMLFIQPGIDKVLRLDHGTLAIGAPTLCRLGVVAAFLTALANPRVRRVA